MSAQQLPGSAASRHGAGDADLAVMNAAHAAFRADLERLARAARDPGCRDPARRQSVTAGWELFKRQLRLHHTAEDEVIWPLLRERLGHSPAALSVLAEMEAEHELIDPLLAAVDSEFTPAGGDCLADAVDALAASLSGHLAHEERDGLPLIGVALSAAEWRAAGIRMGRRNGLSVTGEMFAWMAGSVGPQEARALLGGLPAPVRVLYRVAWKPRFDRVSRC